MAKNDPARKRKEEFIDQIVTRPEKYDKRGIPSKPSESQVVKLKANYFRVTSKHEFSVSLYQVDFEPDTPLGYVKRYLLSQHKERLGFFLFDGGNQLHLLTKLQESCVQLESNDKDGNKFVLKLRLASEIPYTQAGFMQVLNLVVRNAMRGLNLQLVGRNYYDAEAVVG